MKLLNEIIESLSSDSSNLTDALIKTKVLLHEIKHSELVPWVNNELNGYPDEDSLPEYRIVHAEVLVNASNGAWRATNHHVPLGHLTEEQRDSVLRARMDQSIAVIERYASGAGGSLQAHIPMESYRYLGQGLGNGYQIESAWSQIQQESVVQILVQVRSRLLDFLLQLRDQIPKDAEETIPPAELLNNVDTAGLFANAIFGQNVAVVLGSNNVVHSSATARVDVDLIKEIIEQLSQLRDLGLTDDLQSQLTADIETASVQIGSPQPKPGVLKETLSSMRTILEGAAGGAGAHGVIELIKSALTALG